MEWLLIVVSLTVIWVASLCKVLHESLSGSKATFLDDGRGSLKRNVLLVIAHPDDESMFFAPTINYLTSKGHNVHILCMSTGNADGMGDTRKQELYLAAATLKVSPQQVNILDHPDLQDGFGKIWNSDLLAGIVKEEVDGHSIDVVISFDNYGVSGHCNHCDVHRGVRKLLQDTSHKNVEAWELVSTNILRKYIGPVDIWLSILYAKLHPNRQVHFFINERPRKSYAAMAQHRSQWVWFRKLFVSFSSYTFVNSLKKINN
ncbi:probable N-acetylglucosaminyl-phosphatidylinositol de-N-acetylase isoform X1 [Ipomoea triloba]|uniref:probable N-acetylglucosaminyl-phosphatidylinositol de-N-acetylase isoform X1 n=1 Tax=Ipomoea triloba TaxID=35885 RepID=UPI00125E0685|nr:probable N-acetylglucosaminyl-phosphatidylinositol de-N-acetylase isoform X1 [Ipomoea triloba]XP_031131363.1 probable N-acetylglucosaminyl-phosphatidylinositol de-N-acetylase isoform X1 [Ipomoea triloba]